MPRVFVALGTNLGARVGHMRAAVRFLEKLSVERIETSFLYETPPWGVLDQPPFLNAVVKITTTLKPHDLLSELKTAEERLGRVYTRRWGPRQIDLDILLYDDSVIQTGTLTIPHASMHEREFVLRPLCDLVPDLMHPKLGSTMNELLHSLDHDPAIYKVVPVGQGLQDDERPLVHGPETCWPVGQRTRIMGILNITPDSFSDGGLHFQLDDAVKEAVALSHNSTVCAIDIGGQSTRPGAELVGEEEEMNRVIPVIKAIRAAGVLTHISIDTSCARVAEAALEAGADIINGDPSTMNSLNAYEKKGLCAEVVDELSHQVQAALMAGIRRWNIVLDPGIGFAKKGGQNAQLLRSLGDIFKNTLCDGYAVLAGPSRKKFIGTAAGKLDQPASERDWGTAAAISACVHAGVDIVRVHNVNAMSDVVNVANAIWRLDSNW